MTRLVPFFAVLTPLLGLATHAHAQMAGAAPTDAAPFGVAPVGDERIYIHGVFDQLEGRLGNGLDSLRWEGEAWAGTDTNRLWLKSEGETNRTGGVEDGQQEILYDRPVTSYFDVQAGIRYDLDSRPGHGWAALGVEGLAPYFFNVSATIYASDAGHYAAKLQTWYDQLITQRLILQPEIEMNLYARADPARAIGPGLADLDAGLRLRYEITRKFAPYIAATYERKFGATADYARNAGEPDAGLRLTLGIRAWF